MPAPDNIIPVLPLPKIHSSCMTINELDHQLDKYTSVAILVPQRGDHPRLITINLDTMEVEEEGYD